MTIQDLIKKIKSFEGFRPVAYQDAGKGIWTIGYGRTENVTPGETTTIEKEEKWLYDKVIFYINRVKDTNNSYKIGLSNNQIFALADFTYNCGIGNLLTLVDFGRRTKDEIADHILLYNKAGGKVLPGLTKRRQWEHDLFIEDMTNYNDITITQLTFELQAQLNHLIDTYNLPLNKLVTDGIFGPKTESTIQGIANFIKEY